MHDDYCTEESNEDLELYISIEKIGRHPVEMQEEIWNYL